MSISTRPGSLGRAVLEIVVREQGEKDRMSDDYTMVADPRAAIPTTKRR